MPWRGRISDRIRPEPPVWSRPILLKKSRAPWRVAISGSSRRTPRVFIVRDGGFATQTFTQSCVARFFIRIDAKRKFHLFSAAPWVLDTEADPVATERGRIGKLDRRRTIGVSLMGSTQAIMHDVYGFGQPDARLYSADNPAWLASCLPPALRRR